MYYNVDYEVCAAVFMLLLIVFTVWDRKLESFQSKMFRPYVAASFINVCLDIITCYGIEYHEVIPVWVNTIANMLFLTIQFLIPNMFAQYVYYRVQQRKANPQSFPAVVMLPSLIGVVMVISSPVTKLIFYVDSLGYHHGTIHTFLYVNAAAYCVAATIYGICNRRVLKNRQCMYICSMLIVALAPTVIQFFVPHCMLSSVGTALAAFIMFLTNENLVVYEDPITKALNREAFTFHIREADLKNRCEKIFVIALDNFKIINELYGMEGGNELMRMLVDALRRRYSDSRVYRFGGDMFAVILDNRCDTGKEFANIKGIVTKPYPLNDIEVVLSACVCLVHTDNHDREDIIPAIEHGINQAKLMGKGQYFEVDEDAIGTVRRRKAIEQAMIAAIESGHFEVHYQPIFDTAHKKIHSMEALARLNVPGYGYVSPEEFIRIAEQNGSIMQIGMLVLEEVCRFINEGQLKEKGIEYIEVNLSVVQCMQEKLSSDIIGVLDKYGIEHKMINLEITESAYAYSEERLVKNMERLAEADIEFSLDDYGSGYSNINYIVDLPFTIIKIDKYVVWAAMKKETSRKILENTIAMFKNINLKVIAEGIEDWDMAGLITGMGADYLQGYYFSKPIPKDKLLEYLDTFLEAEPTK